MKKSVLLIGLIPLFTGCDKVLFEEDMASTNPKANLDYLWKECDKKYSYFDLKNIDWDEVHDRYSAKIFDNMSQDSLFRVMGDMLIELKDDHTNLISNTNISFFGVNRTGPDNFDWRIVQDNYLPKNYYVSGPFSHDFIKDKEIGYVRFPAFTGTTDKINLNFILERYKDTKGLILDLRENGGGAVSDVFNLLGRFAEERTLLNYSRIRNGIGRNDFSTAKPVYVDPSSEIRYTGKVMMLIDRGSYSASSFTSLATKALPNITLVGDTTGGGLGLPNGGQLPNGWTYRFSVTQALTLDKDESYENGVPPDIRVIVDWNDRTKDEVIERAMVEILK